MTMIRVQNEMNVNGIDVDEADARRDEWWVIQGGNCVQHAMLINGDDYE